MCRWLWISLLEKIAAVCHWLWSRLQATSSQTVTFKRLPSWQTTTPNQTPCLTARRITGQRVQCPSDNCYHGSFPASFPSATIASGHQTTMVTLHSARPIDLGDHRWSLGPKTPPPSPSTQTLHHLLERVCRACLVDWVCLPLPVVAKIGIGY